MKFEFNIHSEYDSLEPEMQYYAQETLRAFEICDQRNHKLI